jgi:hypothetical protein
LIIYGSSLVTAVKDSARLDLQEKGVKLFSCASALDEVILSIVGEAGEGWYIINFNPFQAETTLPGIKAVVETASKCGHQPSTMYISGWIETQVAIEAIRVAIATVGFENLTPRAVRDAFVSIRDFDLGLIRPITITEDAPYANRYWKIYAIRGVVMSLIPIGLKPLTFLK